MKKCLILLILSLFFVIEIIGQKTVNVRGYYRKDGTYVKPHKRSAPGAKTYNYSKNTSNSKTKSNSYSIGSSSSINYKFSQLTIREKRIVISKLILTGYVDFRITAGVIFHYKEKKRERSIYLKAGTLIELIEIREENYGHVTYSANYQDYSGYINSDFFEPQDVDYLKRLSELQDKVRLDSTSLHNSLIESKLDSATAFTVSIEPVDVDSISIEFNETINENEYSENQISPSILVQFFASKSGTKRFDSLEELGSIVTEYLPSRDIYRYKLGYYANTEEANQVIQKLIEFGFKGAHITN